MKTKIKYSIYSQVITAVILVIFVVGVISLWGNNDELILFSVIMGATIVSGLYFCPLSVTVNQSGITLNRLLSKPKFFAYDNIQSVDTCYPSAGGLRLCGSGGFFGYWGYFNDIMIGTYFGYYGSRDSCFLVKLKNGRQYVIGSENSTALVKHVNSVMGN